MRRIIAGFTLTFLLFGGALGFWVADLRSRQIAFADSSSRRWDLEPTENGGVLTLDKRRYRLILPAPLIGAARAASKLLPPDLCAVWIAASDLFSADGG